MQETFWSDASDKGLTAKAVISPTGAVIAKNFGSSDPLRNGDIGLEVRIKRKNAPELSAEQRMAAQGVAEAMSDKLKGHLGQERPAHKWPLGAVVRVRMDNFGGVGFIVAQSDTHLALMDFNEDCSALLRTDYPLSAIVIEQLELPANGKAGLALRQLEDQVERLGRLDLDEFKGIATHFRGDPVAVCHGARFADGWDQLCFLFEMLKGEDPEHRATLISFAKPHFAYDLLSKFTVPVQMAEVALLGGTQENESRATAAIKVLTVFPSDTVIGSCGSAALFTYWKKMGEGRRNVISTLTRSEKLHTAYKASFFCFDVATCRSMLNSCHEMVAEKVAENLAYLLDTGMCAGEDISLSELRDMLGFLADDFAGVAKHIESVPFLETLASDCYSDFKQAQRAISDKWLQLTGNTVPKKDHFRWQHDESGKWSEDVYCYDYNDQKALGMRTHSLALTDDGLLVLASVPFKD